MQPDAALFFAAGLGTRMRPLTIDRPKPLVSVAGRALIDHALDFMGAPGPIRAVVNVHFHAGMVEDHLKDRPGIEFSDERDQLLETGGGLRKALPTLGAGPVYTMNTDAVWSGPNPFSILADAWDPDRMDGLLLVVPTENALGHNGNGDFDVDPNGLLSRGKDVIYTGAQIIEPAGLSEIEDEVFSLNLLWDRMLAGGRLFGVRYPGKWCDVGRPETIALAENMLGWSANV